MKSMRRIVRAHGVWLAVSVVFAVVLAAASGYWFVVFGYAAFNGVGAVLYLDGLDPRQAAERRKRRVVELLAAALLPVGLFGLLASKGGTDPIDSSLGDEGVRNHTAASNVYGRGRGTGGF